jgi:gamma-glutamyltranspeptidase/glutathione hydrolase
MVFSTMSKTAINRSQGRSVVVSTGGVVASEHPLASQAGAMALAQGGHAVDAAIAANAVMGVVCPMMCGIGGDLFAIVCERDGTLHGVNASGWAPARLTPDLLESRGEQRHAAKRRSLGDRPWCGRGMVAASRSVWPVAARAPARASIALAENGFPVAEITSEEWHIQEAFLRGDPESRGRFCRPGGRSAWVRFSGTRSCVGVPPDCGGGGEAFYRGDIARRLVEGLDRRGSTMAQPTCPSSARSGPILFRRPTVGGRSTNCRRTAPDCRADDVEHP